MELRQMAIQAARDNFPEYLAKFVIGHLSVDSSLPSLIDSQHSLALDVLRVTAGESEKEMAA